MPHDIAVLGGGSWGTAVSILLHANGNRITVWEFDPEDFRILTETRENRIKLPGIPIPREIKITNDLEEAVREKEVICFVVPSHTVRTVSRNLSRLNLSREVVLVNLAKGIEMDTLRRMSEVLIEEIGSVSSTRIVTVSGPSHAEEVARCLPTSVVAACGEIKTAELVRDIFSNHFFRAYSSPDIIGVELGGSLKNIIAIASGILDGLGGGDNAKGALFTRGIAEIARLGAVMGAHPLTFAGLSGLGDLVTTCISRHSRNRAFGEKIGQGKSFNEALSEMTMVVEGVKTTKATFDLMHKYDVEMPIAAQVNEVLFEGKDPRRALTELMTRNLKSEI